MAAAAAVAPTALQFWDTSSCACSMSDGRAPPCIFSK